MKINSWFEIEQGGYNAPLWTATGSTLAEAEREARQKFEQCSRPQLPCLLSVKQIFDDAPVEAAAQEIVRDVAHALGRDSSSFRDKCWRKRQREKLRKSFDLQLLEFACRS